MSKKPFLTLLTTAAISAVAAMSVPVTAIVAAPSAESKAEAKKFSNKLYIVRMSELPVSAYDGRIKGLPATKPRKGEKIDPNSPAVIKYKAHLESRHDEVLAAVGGGTKAYSYGYVFNGFTAELSADQASALSRMPGILGVTKDAMVRKTTSTTPTFLGLDAPGGVWDQLSGNFDGNPISSNGPNSSGAGEGVVVGIIDSGIWPENGSFSDRDASGKLIFQQLPGWHGKCVPGEKFTASSCNQKLISARFYGAGFGGGSGIKAQFPYEFVSPRAADGHGVHTASTAAGNYSVDAITGGTSYGRISGMAPRARVAVYKTCWGIPPEGGCFNSDNVAAIDQAVADGVDVINYSISGTNSNFRDPVEIAFLYAADAGVFVAASAGNSGAPTDTNPTGASTVAHPSPWITTVAASTHDRAALRTVILGNGSTYTGASVSPVGVGPAALIDASAAGLPGVDSAQLSKCYGVSDGATVLDPAKVAGKIVVCDRGTTNRVNKSLAVKQAGGIGMVLVNVTLGSVNADLHSVPSVHLAHTERDAIKAYAATTGATATIGESSEIPTAPVMAEFSSKGPLIAGGGDLLKPDITAPGVDVLAAYSPIAGGNNFDFLSGTSMSSPHIAGLAALMKAKYPTWSPMAIKSALMTTAYQTTKSGTPGELIGAPFDFGAGHVEINQAVNPGLVFDSGYRDWLGFLCGTQLPASFCTGSSIPIPVLDPSNLNVPSIAIGNLAGSQTVTRTVTNVSGYRATFTAATSGLMGIDVAVNPASFTLDPGKTQTLEVTFTNKDAQANEYSDGAIVWTSDKDHTVRIPTVVRPVALAAPASVSSNGAPISYGVTFGYTGAFSAAVRGLILPAVTGGTVLQDPDQTFEPSDPTGTVAIPVTIPAGTTYTRISLFDADVAAGSDMDLYVYVGDEQVGISASGTSAEEVNFAFATPTDEPTDLMVYVHGWGLPSGSSPFKLHAWNLGTANAGNVAVTAPATATVGGTGTINLTPDPAKLTSGRWLGSVVYGGYEGMPSPTIVRIDK